MIPSSGQLTWLAILLVVLSGLLAAAEAACTRVSRGRVEDLVEEGRRGADALQRVVDTLVPTVLVASFLRVLFDVSAAVCLAGAFSAWVPAGWGVAAAAIGTGAALLFVARVGMATLGRQRADGVALVAAPVLFQLTRVLGPLARLLVVVANALTPGRGFRDGPFSTEAELREMVDMASERSLIEAEEREMIHSVFQFGDTLVREVMVPRTDLVPVSTDTPLRGAMSLFLRSGFSRVPVEGEDLDDIRGVLYLKDLARRLHEDPDWVDTHRVADLMRPAAFVPDSKPAGALLREMQAEVPLLAVVVDEYGGTAGLVTLEDLVEEIVGEIADEYDEDTDDVEDLGEGRFRVSARLHVEDVGALFGLEIEDDDVDTVGGLLAKALGRVPIAASSADVAGLRLTADRFEGRRHRLDTVIVERLAAPPAPRDGAGRSSARPSAKGGAPRTPAARSGE